MSGISENSAMVGHILHGRIINKDICRRTNFTEVS